MLRASPAALTRTVGTTRAPVKVQEALESVPLSVVLHSMLIVVGLCRFDAPCGRPAGRHDKMERRIQFLISGIHSALRVVTSRLRDAITNLRCSSGESGGEGGCIIAAAATPRGYTSCRHDYTLPSAATS